MQTIKGDDYLVRYDDATRVVYGIYHTTVTPESTVALYKALHQLFETIDTQTLNGLVIDFRCVQHFAKGNIMAVQRESHALDQKHNLSVIPIALVVDTPLQEQIVDFMTKVTPEPDRKHIVYSIAEAFAHFDRWHSEFAANA